MLSPFGYCAGGPAALGFKRRLGGNRMEATRVYIALFIAALAVLGSVRAARRRGSGRDEASEAGLRDGDEPKP